ncbi:MAG: YbaB/EbfC family DNA-binding protein [Actinobacteria bacterium]|nr:YbaB/EbfC family DNA-binding protein [Actinomycetota bacterium]
MVGQTPPDPDDEHDDLAALDFFTASGASDESDLDALGDFGVVVQTADDKGDLTAIEPLEPDEDALPVPVFAVTNPSGTVTVSAYLDGRVRNIDLSPKASDMTETHLAEEIVVIAGLATQDARSAQYAFMLKGMREQGHDDVTTRDFLTRDLDLPTPEQASAHRAAIFATRYAADNE